MNKEEKRNLCDWLCSQGAAEAFRHFEVVFDILEQVVQTSEPSPTDASSEVTPS